MRKHLKRLIPLLVLVGLLATTGIAQAQLKTTAVVYAWDFVAEKFENGNVVIPFDGTWVPFLHELKFDDDDYVGAYPVGCTTATKWAGEMKYGLYNVDNDPAGAEGFQSTREWKLVACDRDGDGDFDNTDLGLPLAAGFAAYTGAEFLVGPVDVVEACTTGNCTSEIVTTIFVNTDSDCDGVQNDDIPAGGLCFYAEAETPVREAGDLIWSNPLQARIWAGGGEKTVNFKVEGDEPSAVTLASFETASQGNAVLLVGVVLLVTAALVAGVRLARSSDKTKA